MNARFGLAPMDGMILALTVLVWSLPAVLLWHCVHTGNLALYVILAILLAIFSSVWLFWRPGQFVVSDGGLELIFPLRRKLIPREQLTGCRVISYAEFKEHFGWAVRVGAGGLWGGFGWLRTQRRGWVEFYISRLDTCLLIERGGELPLLITPDDPHKMAQALAL